MVDITIVNGVYKPTYNWGAPSCMPIKSIQFNPLDDCFVPHSGEIRLQGQFFLSEHDVGMNVNPGFC